MPLFAQAQQSAPPWLASIVLWAILISLGVWVWLAQRLSQRKPLLPYQPRRTVPWRGVHLLLVLLIYVLAQAGITQLACGLSGALASAEPGAAPRTTRHVVEQLLAEKNCWFLLLGMVVAAVVAPIVEEFLFRVLLQGWLEAVERRLRRYVRALYRVLPIGLGPIVISSLLFAGMHFRKEQPAMPVRLIVCLLIGNALANLLTMVCAIVLLRALTGATAADFGWAPQKLGDDVKLGLVAFAAAVVPVYAVQIVLQALLPKNIAPDPFALLFFAILLGTLYCRTHRSVPSVVTHATLNAAGLAIGWWVVK